MSATTLASPAPETSKPMNRLVRAAAIAAVAVAIVCFALGTRHYIQFVKAGKAIETRYADLDLKFPYAPGKNAAPSAERFEKMFAARQKLMQSLPPAAEATAQELIGQGGAGTFARAAKLLSFDPAWKNAALAHADTLEQAGMSLTEYRQLLGIALAALLKPETKAEGADAWRELSSELGDTASIEKSYGAASLPADLAIDAVAQRLAAGGIAQKLIDLSILDSLEGAQP